MESEVCGTAGIELPPVAPLLMQSLRSIGYTLQAALADLIDNSITAGAREVSIEFGGPGAPMLAVLDNGIGMSEEALVMAMRFGSRDPREPRDASDLGRFGLGLKTASLSQCRRLTVASLHEGTMSLARWDLDECERRGTWWLVRPGPWEVPGTILGRITAQGCGTAVIWQQMDRLAPAKGADPLRVLEVAMDEAADHLGLTFHRFLSGEIVGPFDIRLNGRQLPQLDPFLAGHARGQSLHSETFTVEGRPVSISPFVLPFPSRLAAGELARAGGREGLKTGHGFYVYRGGRLVVPGGWFRIVPSDQLVRLARVRVDVPVELDHLWKVDIRKAVAEPPPALRPHLRRIVGDVTERSRRVYTYKGTPHRKAEWLPLWQRRDGRDGAASWVINRDHPIVSSTLLQAQDEGDVERLLRHIEDNLPAHDIYLHISNDLPLAEPTEALGNELDALAARLVAAFEDQPDMVSRLLDRLPWTEPFSRDPERARRIAEELR